MSESRDNLDHKAVDPGDSAYPAAEVDELRANMHAMYRHFLTGTSSEEEWRNVQKEVEAAGREAGERLDSLTTDQRREYVERYCLASGFPNTAVTSKRILTHHVEAVHAVAGNLGSTLAAILYAPSSSVDRAMALPGSDVDYLTIVTRDDNARADAFYEQLPNHLDPSLTSIREGFVVLSLKEWLGLADYLATHEHIDESYLYDHGWSEGKLWRARLGLAYLGGRTELMGNLWPEERTRLVAAADRERRHQDHLARTWHKPEKYAARERLIRAFPELSVDEQFLIIRILQIDSEAIALDATDTGPHLEVLQGLVAKGLLAHEHNLLKAPWAPYPWLFRSLDFWFYPEELYKRTP